MLFQGHHERQWHELPGHCQGQLIESPTQRRQQLLVGEEGGGVGSREEGGGVGSREEGGGVGSGGEGGGIVEG